MILHFLYNEANCLSAAREFIQNSPQLSHIRLALSNPTDEVPLFSAHLHTAKMTVSQILRRFLMEHQEFMPDQGVGMMRISPTRLGMVNSSQAPTTVITQPEIP